MTTLKRDLHSVCILHIIRIISHYRWKEQAGFVVGKGYQFWDTGEPDVVDFDYNKRKITPLNTGPFRKCGTQPSFTCSLDDSFHCNNNHHVAPTIDANHDGGHNNDKTGAIGHCTEVNRCRVPTGPDNPIDSTIFSSFDEIKEATGESDPACMIVYGPDLDFTSHTQDYNHLTVDVNTGAINTDEYDSCDLLFDIEVTEHNFQYKKWSDINCARKTHSLMCAIIGKL